MTGSFISRWESESKQEDNLSLTDTAWQLLEQQANFEGISKSELVERYARSLQLNTRNSVAEIENSNQLQQAFVAASDGEHQQADNELEQRVKQRTAELMQANAMLQQQNIERQRAIEALYNREQNFKALLENSPDVISRLNRELRFIYVNPAVEKATGIPASAFIGKTHAELGMPKEIYPFWDQKLREVFATAKEQTIEFEFPSPRGLRFYQTRIVPFNREGLTEYVLAISRDVTQSKRAEAERAQLIREQTEREALQRQAELLSLIDALLSAAPVAVCFFDHELKYIRINQVMAALNGLSVEAHLGRKCSEVLPEMAAKFEPLLQQVLKTGEPILNREISGEPPGKPGEYGYWLGNYYPVRDADGQTIGIGVILADITETKQVEAERDRFLKLEQAAREEAEAANRIKDEFLAVLSHELRTPLNPILGWVKLLRSCKFDETKTAAALEIIERNAKVQAQLIEDLLNVSQILQGKLSLNACPVNLAFIITAAIANVQLSAAAKQIQIESIITPNLEQVFGDSSRLQQVVWNLLSNAVKFTPAGGWVKIYLEPVNNQAQIKVSDNGKGINSNFLPYVFDPFRQADSTITRICGGLGLGLTIVRHLVEMHGGTVQAESLGEGQGATFTFRLPLMTTGADVTGESQQLDTVPDLSSIRILCVDDDADSRELVVLIMEQYGAAVTTVTSAHEAIAALVDLKPDLLLSDIGMPEVDGYMLMRQVRALEPEQGGQIPAIALTAYAGEINHQQALAAGFQAHLTKPVEPDHLVRVVVSLIRTKTVDAADECR